MGVCLYIYWPDDSYIPLPLHENLSLNQIDERRELPLAGDASSGRLPPDQWKPFLPEVGKYRFHPYERMDLIQSLVNCFYVTFQQTIPVRLQKLCVREEDEAVPTIVRGF